MYYLIGKESPEDYSTILGTYEEYPEAVSHQMRTYESNKEQTPMIMTKESLCSIIKNCSKVCLKDYDCWMKKICFSETIKETK